MFEEMLRQLVARGIRFVVVGGVAATIHGSARYTNDLDICYATDPENLRRLVALLTDWTAYLRGVEPGLPFILDERTFAITPLLTLVTKHGDFDLLDHVPGVGSYADVLARSEEAQLGPVRFHTISLEALIDAKRATRRKKDIEHLIELEALQLLRDEGASPA